MNQQTYIYICPIFNLCRHYLTGKLKNMKAKFILLACALVLGSLSVDAQEKYNHFHIGVEAGSGFGAMAAANFNIADNMAIGPIVRGSFQPYSSFFYSGLESRIGVGVQFHYYFDSLMDSFMNWPKEVDLYAGGNGGPFFRFRTYSGPADLEPSYNSVGVFVNAVVGGRYHFSDKMSVFAEVLGGYGHASGARAGLAFGL